MRLQFSRYPLSAHGKYRRGGGTMRKALLVSATLLGLMAFVPSANACGWRGYGYRPIYAGYGWGYSPYWRGGWGYRGWGYRGWGYRGGWGRRW